METTALMQDALRLAIQYHDKKNSPLPDIFDTARKISEFLVSADAPPPPPVAVKPVWSELAVKAFQRAATDPADFMSYLTFSGGQGRVQLVPYPDQIRFFDHVIANRKSLVYASRQAGSTMVGIVYALWMACFQNDQTILLVGQSYNSAIEMMARLQALFNCLPNELKPSIREYNKGSISFDNGCRVVARACHADSCRGLTINLLLVDNARFISDRLANDFIMSVLPIMAFGGQCIITSSGDREGGFFHNLWTNPENGFSRIELDGSEHPDRGPEWVAKTRAQLGPQMFDREYGMEFSPAAP